MPVRIAVIGAGPCGLSQLHAFESARKAGEKESPEIVCFEKQSDWGGLWRYTWQTGLDEYGEPVHGSMYRNLWNNVAKENFELADYSYDQHFGQPIPSYVSREVVYDYITGRAEKSGIRKYIHFDTVVRWITYSEGKEKFTVTVKNLKEDQETSSEFDYLVVATGHFSTPDIPFIKGIETFPGRVLHSHDFRDAREFTGKRILIVGSSYSAEDIGLQCFKYKAKSITCSYRKKPMCFSWPENFREVPLLTSVVGQTAHFQDGTSDEVDAIILCTGYLHHFPFLPDDLRLRTNNRFYPISLYKGIFVPAIPRLMYLGMQNQIFTFNMFDVQAWYVRDVVLGKIKLPLDPQVMASDIAVWVGREHKIVEPVPEAVNFQMEYVQDLAKATDCPYFDFSKAAANFRVWDQQRRQNILTYRNNPYISIVTGTKASIHRTPWLEEFDSSVDAFTK